MIALQAIDDETHTREIVLEDLGGDARDLYGKLGALRCGHLIFRLFVARENTFWTVDDIAYYICQSSTGVTRDLESLVELGVARRVDAAGVSLYGVTDDPTLQSAMHDLFNWQVRWQTRLQRINRMILGEKLYD